MTTFKLKLFYILELIVAIIAIFVFAATVNDEALIPGVGLALLWIVGGRHMIALGRSGWWGVLAATGLGALIILFVPKKSNPQ
jgi:hypothetical protein